MTAKSGLRIQPEDQAEIAQFVRERSSDSRRLNSTTVTVMVDLQEYIDAYEEQWTTTLRAIRTTARLGKWSSRIVDDSDPDHLCGVITIYAKHKQIRQAVEVVVTPAEVYLKLYDIGPGDDDEWVDLWQTGSLKRGDLLARVRRTVNAWRKVQRVDSIKGEA